MTVRLEDLAPDPPDCPVRAPITTAHVQCARFYRKHFRDNHPEPSIVERLLRAPSPFAVEQLVGDFERLIAHRVPAKKRAQVHEVARVRVCELRGVLP